MMKSRGDIMADFNLKYVVNGKPVINQLMKYQYDYFLTLMRRNKMSVELAFKKAKRHRRSNNHFFHAIKYTEEVCYENKLNREIAFFKKEIDRLQSLYKRKFGKEYLFCLPIPLKASQELESVMLATRCGILLEKMGEK